MDFNSLATVAWLPLIFLLIILALGFLIRATGGNEPVATPPPPPPHDDHGHGDAHH